MTEGGPNANRLQNAAVGSFKESRQRSMIVCM